MSPLGVILKARSRALWHRIASFRQESSLKIAVVTVIGSGLWIGVFAGARRSLRFLSRFPEVREEVLYAVFALFFLTLTVLLIFSSAILALGALFKTQETRFLLSTPSPAGSVYAYKMLDGLIFSSWAFLVMGLPPMLAYGLDVGAPATYYLALPGFFIPFTVMTSSVGTLLALLVTGVIPRQRGKLLGLILAATGAAGLYAGWKAFGGMTEATGFPFAELWKERVLGRLSFLWNRHMPHTWVTKGLLMTAAGKGKDALLPWAALVSSGAVAYLLGDFVARRLYAPVWSLAASGSASRKGRRGGLPRLAGRLFRFSGRLPALFVEKDLRTFLRDPLQWSQVAIFFGLLGIYILNLRRFQYDFTKGFWIHLISTLNLGASTLTLATLTTRFVFPQISLEGRKFWVLGLAPVRRGEILRGKFLFALGGALVVAEGLVILSNLMLGTPRAVFAIQAVAGAFACVGLTGLAVGMGAIFPNYKEPNPSRIVSGFGGTLTLLFSVGLVVIIVAAVAVPSHMRLVRGLLGPGEYVLWASLAVAVAAAASFLAAAVPLYLGTKALERAEL